MKRSIKRILSTHTGSLPRPNDLVEMLRAKDAGEAHDFTTFPSSVRSAVAQAVRKQVECGIDIVNDGEMGKPSYATYVKDRLNGFEGEKSSRMMGADLAEFPGYMRTGGRSSGVGAIKRPSCSGPIKYRDTQALRTDIDNLKSALGEVKAEEAFMTAASPGVVAFFLDNTYYPSHEAYIQAVAEALKVEYETIVEAGFVLQVDCPDFGMGRHVQFKDRSLAEFRKIIEIHVEALNHALANIPPECVRVHLCWGNYEGPHHHDVALRDIIDIVFKARAGAISYEASNPRHEHEWAIFKDVRLPDGKILIPGVIDSVTNFIEHPELVAQRICNLARVVGRENVIAGTDCGFGTIAGTSRVDSEIAWAKLKSMAEGARIATSQLW